MPTDSSGLAIVQPIRQPVTEYVFDIELIETVRSAIPGSVASGMCSPVVDDVLVDVVGEGDGVVLLAERRRSARARRA